MVKIFIGNLGTREGVAAITARDLKPLFDTYGTVTECVVKENTAYGFVHMPEKKEAFRAIRGLNGCQVVGQRINVELSTAGDTAGIGKISSQSSNVGQMLGAKKKGTSITNIQASEVLSIPSLGDCYNYLFNECLKKEKCPYIHRMLPNNICKKFLFGKCSRPERCSREHLDSYRISELSHREIAKVKAVSQTGSCLETGARKKTTGSGLVRQQTVGKSAFQCHDCGVTTPSCSLLETHLNTVEHLERLNRIKFEGEELKGVDGNSEDVLCEVCEVRVKLGNWEKHTEEELHMALNTEQGDWVTVGEISSPLPTIQFEKESPDIHVTNIPPDMTMNKFRLICLQFGQVTKLKMLAMDRSKGQHAYVRYNSDQVGDIAALELKKLQKCLFADRSGQFLDSGEKLESKPTRVVNPKKSIFGCKLCGAVYNSMRELGEHKKSHGFICDLCDVVCNSCKQLEQHQKSHLKAENDEENNYLYTHDPFEGEVSEDQVMSLSISSKDEGESVALLSPVSLQELNLNQLNSKLEQLALAREEQEKKLMFCQNKMMICKHSGERTLQLLEEELEIQRKLRDLEVEERNSMPSYLHSAAITGYIGEVALSDGVTVDDDSIIKSSYNPDDVFNSDDSLDEDAGYFLQSQRCSAQGFRDHAVLDQQVTLNDSRNVFGVTVDNLSVAAAAVEAHHHGLGIHTGRRRFLQLQARQVYGDSSFR